MTPFVLSIVSALLLWAAFFPLNLGPFAFVALVPFLGLVRAEGIGNRRRYGAAFVGGIVFFALAINWVRVAHPMMMMFTWPALTVYGALYWPLALYLLRRLDNAPASSGLLRLADDPRGTGPRRPPLALTLPLVWVGLEYVRANFPTGFPFLSHVGLHQSIGFGWYFLGYAQHDFLALIQCADLGGVYLVSAFVAAVNGAAYEWVVRISAFRRCIGLSSEWRLPTYFREFAVTAVIVGIAATLLTYGGYRLIHVPFEPGPLVAAVQGSLPQNEKILRAELKEGEKTPLEKEYFPLAAQAVGGGSVRKADLVIWPETCFPENWNQLAPGASASSKLREEIRLNQLGFIRYDLGKLPEANMLLGLNRLEWSDEVQHRKYNSAMLVRADGTVGEHYDKIHLVPFGEYVPLRESLPWLKKFTPYKHDYSCTPGEAYTRFELPASNGKTYRFGVLICYEDSDPYMARRYNPFSMRGPSADFLVNISNDGWFDGTEEHEQHLAICRFRAVESRRSVVRAVNMGISAVIDPDGRVIALPGESWSESKKVRGIVRHEVPIGKYDSVYAAAGDWVPALCWLMIAMSLAAGRLWGRTKARAQ